VNGGTEIILTPELEGESSRDHDLSIHKEEIMTSSMDAETDVCNLNKEEEEKTFRIDVIDRDVDNIWKDYEDADPSQLQQRF